MDVYIVISEGISLIEIKLNQTHLGAESAKMTISAHLCGNINPATAVLRAADPPILIVNPSADWQNSQVGVRG